MSETLAAIEDYTRLTIARLRGELPLDERARLESLEAVLRDRIEGARPAPRKIENPTAVAPARPSMNVKPAQVTVTRRGPGDESAAAQPAVVPVRQPPRPPSQAAPPPRAAPTAPPPPARTTPAPPRPREPDPELARLSLGDRSKLQEISAQAMPTTGYTPSTSPLYMDDYYESTLAPDHSLSGNMPAQRVLTLGDDTQALPEEARIFLGLSEDAPVVRSPSSVGSFGLSLDDGEATELRGDGEETEAREPHFATAPQVSSPFAARAAAPRDNSDTAAGATPAQPAAPTRPPPSRTAPPPAAAPPTPARTAPPPAPRAPPPARARPEPVRAPEPARAREPVRAAEPVRPAEPVRAAEAARPIVPIIVQLLGGETKRGELVAFAPTDGIVTLRATPQSADESVDVNDVFAVFVGHARGVAPMPATGTRIAVRMTNDREVVGVSPDYAPGANSMTLVPDDRRTVDRIWIPAWSVTEIRFA